MNASWSMSNLDGAVTACLHPGHCGHLQMDGLLVQTGDDLMEACVGQHGTHMSQRLVQIIRLSVFDSQCFLWTQKPLPFRQGAEQNGFSYHIPQKKASKATASKAVAA